MFSSCRCTFRLTSSSSCALEYRRPSYFQLMSRDGTRPRCCASAKRSTSEDVSALVQVLLFIRARASFWPTHRLTPVHSPIASCSSKMPRFHDRLSNHPSLVSQNSHASRRSVIYPPWLACTKYSIDGGKAHSAQDQVWRQVR